MDMLEKKKGTIGVGVAVIIGVIVLVIIFALLPVISTSITNANLSGNDATIAGLVPTLTILVAVAVVVGLIVYAFAMKQ